MAAGLGTIACIVNMKVMSYANLSRLISTNGCLRGGPFNIKARARFAAMSLNKSAAFVLAAGPKVHDYNEHVVGGSSRGQER